MMIGDEINFFLIWPNRTQVNYLTTTNTYSEV